jgi:glyoxylase-like metal-dependent hydrolase (beta-lactamase superfamily II)
VSLVSGQLDEVAPGVRRLVANNAGYLTGPGTNTYLGEYLDSLRRLQREPLDRIAPGHGLIIEDAQREIARIIAHRLQRKAKVVSRLTEMRSATIEALVAHVYDDVDARLHTLAKSSLLAHLIKLEEDGRAGRDSEADDAVWSLLNA